jgi:Mrp family chromosome partitioning ATPase
MSAFKRALAKIRDSADMTVIDSPPMLAVSDTSVIAAQVDAVVVVVNRRTSIARLVDLRQRLDLVGAPLIGYVYNRDTSRRSGAYGYGYGDDEGDQSNAGAQRRSLRTMSWPWRRTRGWKT